MRYKYAWITADVKRFVLFLFLRLPNNSAWRVPLIILVALAAVAALPLRV